MSRINAFIFATTVLALPLSSAEAQEKTDSVRRRPGSEAMLDRRRAPDMAGRILEMRSELKLTDAQVSRLTSIQKEYGEKNAKLLEKVRSTRGADLKARGERPDSVRQMTPEQRQETRKRMQAEREAFEKAHPELAETRREMAKNNEAASKEIRDVLTDEQEAQLRQRMAERRDGGFRGRRGGPDRRGQDRAPRS